MHAMETINLLLLLLKLSNWHFKDYELETANKRTKKYTCRGLQCIIGNTYQASNII